MPQVHHVSGSETEALRSVLKDAEEDQQRLAAALSDPRSTVYALSLDGQAEPIGGAVVAWGSSAHELRYLGIAEHWRSRGYGSHVVAHLTEELNRRGGTLTVGTGNSSLDNIGFYQRRGFRMASVRSNYFADLQPPVEEFGIRLRDMIVFEIKAEGATEPIPHRPSVRIARRSNALAACRAFYNDDLGLAIVAEFHDHDGFDGTVFALGESIELELVATPNAGPLGRQDPDDQLVLIVGDTVRADELVERLRVAGHDLGSPDNPYWRRRMAVTVSDPEGRAVLLVPTDDETLS